MDYIISMAISNRLIELTPSTLHSHHFIKIVLGKISNDLHEAKPHRLFFLYILSPLEAYFTVDHLFPFETFSSHGFQVHHSPDFPPEALAASTKTSLQMFPCPILYNSDFQTVSPSNF